MKEAIYSWIKCLAIFYILLTMLIHLVPTGKYQRYVRFFMGLLLMVMLITPMLSILDLISNGKDISWVIAQLDRFLPFVDNWATCDLTRPKIFQKHLPELLPKVKEWLASDHEYTVRFGIGMLLSFYLDRAFQPEYLTWVASLHRQEYYVNMMIAWYFATALAKQYEAALPYLQSHCLEQWTHNKAIQKALESTRIPPEHKEILRTLKRKQEKE